MKRAVMISIHPKWVHKILDGKKTVEVRKTVPKIATPFKCYIYMTSGGWEWRDPFSTAVVPPSGVGDMYCGAKKVVAEFISDRIIPINVLNNGAIPDWTRYNLNKSCVPYDDIVMYIGNNRSGYGWHISELKIYDKPKELSDFYRPCICPEMPYCPDCPVGGEYISETELEFLAIDGECRTEWYCNNRLKRPPQSWCYVEELNDGEKERA